MPERDLLSITRRGSRWLINELRCACNRPPAPETTAAVQEWLGSHKHAPHLPSGDSDEVDWSFPPLPEREEEYLMAF